MSLSLPEPPKPTDRTLHMEGESVSVEGSSVAVNLLACRELQDTAPNCHKQSKVPLPDYVLDFGYVIPGQVLTGVLNVTNSGSVPLSLSANTKCLAGTGFSVEFERVKNLPCGVTHAFTVKFNPQESKLKMGPNSVLMPVQASHGGRMQVQLCAVLTQPTIAVSTDTLQFDTLQCGMCQIKPIWLNNDGFVTCHWNMSEEVKPLKKVDKFLPLYKRKKPQARPVVFEIIPSSGTLGPGEQVDVQIKFCPSEGVAYSRRLIICVDDNPLRTFLTACGQAVEAQLQFCPSVLELGACLPSSTEAEAEVTVKNLSSFPVEFYSLELDKTYLEEEKMLQMILGNDEKSELLLPPIQPGQSLPIELVEYYKEYCSHRNGENLHETAADLSCRLSESGFTVLRRGGSSTALELLTPGPSADREHQHRGSAIIVYGAPLTDTSSVAVAIANHYEAVWLTIDGVVTDALINGTSPVSLKARELCESAVAKNDEKKTTEAEVLPATNNEDEAAADPNDGSTILQLCLETKVPLSDILPQDLLVDILIERFQKSDGCWGLVIDGLASAFTCSTTATLQAALEALKTCKHISVVNLHDTYDAMKERESAQKQAEEVKKKEEAEKEVQWLRSLDDDQCHGLPNEVKTNIIQQHVAKLRQKKLRDLERHAKEKEERMKKLKEEELLKAKKAARKDSKEPPKKKSTAEMKESSTTPKMPPPINSKVPPHHTGQPSQSTEALFSPVKEADPLQKHAGEPRPAQEDKPLEVDERQALFAAYEKSCEQVKHILQHWDLAHGLLLVPLPDNGSLLVHRESATRRQIPAAKTSARTRDKTMSAESSKTPTLSADTVFAIPHIEINVSEEEHLRMDAFLKNASLPPPDQMVADDESVGLHYSTIYSVVPFPKRRDEVGDLTCDCFTFLTPTSPVDHEEKEGDPAEVQTTASKVAAPTRSQSRGSAKETLTTKEQDKKGRDARTKRRAAQRVSPLPDVAEPSSIDHHSSILDTKRKQSLTKFRWIVPANGEVVLKMWFYSEHPGTFSQTFNFELVGTRRLYQLPCRGICTYPSICTNHMTLFPTCEKVKTMLKQIEKAYVTDPGYFEFGPLLFSKTRDSYKENRYPENTQSVVIHNNSALAAEIQFSFQEDNHGTTFLLDPPAMSLQPDQKQELTVWAFPTKVGQITDSIVCSVQDSSEHFSVDISCWGVRPDLRLESKQFHFEKILLHREESRTIVLHNKGALPVSWRLQGIEELGDEFTVPQSYGIIGVASSFPLTLKFKSRRPLLVRKNLRLEINDAEKIFGTAQSEILVVIAEAYDVALEISPEGCLNFGTLKVFEENKLTVKIKNQGKYDIAFRFLIQQIAPTLPDLASVFTVCPHSGILKAHDKASTLHILCRPSAEFSVREQPILSCQVIEPKLGDGGEVIANVAINVSVIGVFSRYKITPACDLNFGPLAYGCKKSQTFTIENTGALETRFRISTVVPAAAGKISQKKSDRTTGTGTKARRESLAKETRSIQSALSMGVFSVSPCAGGLQPGSLQTVTVYCTAEQLGVWNQGLLIDISDRDPLDHGDGIPYRLLAEVCKPSIMTDPASIFEEYYTCCTSRQLSSEPFCSTEGVFVQEENRFIFQKVPVGRTVQAHFKLFNNSKVSCTLNLAIRSVGAKERQTSQNTEVFGLLSSTLLIPSQSYSFSSVTFTPQMMQVYNAVFEATLEQSTRLTPTSKSKALEFYLTGESVLPHVSVLCPTLRNSEGNPVMHFIKVSVGNRHTQPLVLLNNGHFPVQAHVDVLDEHGLFALRPSPGNSCSFIYSTPLEGTTDSECPAASSLKMSLKVNEQVQLEVIFCSNRPVKAQTKIMVCLEDNKHITTTIHVTGDACEDIVSCHNVNRSSQEVKLDVDNDACEVLSFSDCYVNQLYQQTCIMANHHSSRVFRFAWTTGSNLCFFPQGGHLHAGCSKEVKVMFRSNEPVKLKNHSVICKLCEVAFEQSVEEVADWSERQKSLQWLNSSRPASAASKQSTAAKVAKADEPACSVVEGSQWEMNLYVNAVCDYVSFKCSTGSIIFEDTMVFQTRQVQFHITNESQVKLEFSFQLVLDSSNNPEEDIRSAGDLSEAAPLKPELPPISIEPCTGFIEAEKMKTFSVCFSPARVAEYRGRLVCSIPNLHKGKHAPCILVSGRSLLPLCHFYLEDSDFIRKLSSNPEFTGHLSTDTRVIEFSTVVLRPSIRSFDVLNPTKDLYTFKWKCEDSGCSPFRCLNPCGTILPGKTVQACFEYVSEKIKLVHSSWSFVIEPLSLSVPFLCVGITREPQLYLSKRQLDFGELPLGYKAQQFVDLVNCEEETFHFAILESSLLCEDQKSLLKLEPLSGVIQPNARLSLSVSFTPCCKGQKRFRLVLRMKKKPEPLVLTVKASCLPMAASLQVKMPDCVTRRINPDEEETLNFGEVEKSEQSFFYFLLTNQSKFSMVVNIELTGNVNLLQHLKAEHQNAVIDVGNHLQTSLLFSPRGICNLQDVNLKIKVKLGPSYFFAIKGKCSAPSVEFSFTRHNFGKCLLHHPGMVPASTTLVICNKGLKDVGLQCQFRNTPYMELDCGTNVLPPGAFLDVPIRFLPRELCPYHEKATFVLNSCITREVSLLGHGVKMKLEVEDPRQRKLNFGCLNSGCKMKKRVKLVNRSSIDVSFKLLLNTQLDQKDLSLNQTGELKLKASDGSCFVEILFSPHQRLAAFTAELLAQCAGVSYPLLTLQGSCPGVKVQLDRGHLAFGAVVQHCQASRKIVMINSGDVGTSFRWKIDKLARGLSITPAKGFIRPGMEIPLDVTFAPATLSEDIRYEASCAIGSSSVLGLTVTGSCIVASTNKEVLQFVCPVRGCHTQMLQVNNPMTQQCRIIPVLKGGPWRVAPFLDLEPLETKTIEITYQPMKMTADGTKDLASVFFSFPDGSGVKFRLQGIAEPPKVEDTIVCQLPAKTEHTVVLCVHNWLPKKQQFRVLMEFLKPDKPDATMSITGLPFIDVPALARKDYKMSFFTYREGQYNTKVTFQNATSGEYLFYLVTFESLPAGPLSTVELVATVREKVSGSVTVENPLSNATCLTMECKCPEISVPSEHTVPGESKGSVSFEYQPLHARHSTARLTLHSAELGYFHYDLSLRALPPAPERTVHFSVPLGRSQVELVKFISYSHVKTEYSCSTDSPAFTVDKTVTASPGHRQPSEAAVSVCFEPYQLGDVQSLLTLSSDIGGQYTFVLRGTCVPPQAHGPLTIKPGRSLNIPFKNVFLQQTTYSFQVNNPCFVVKGFNPNFAPRKAENIAVSLEVPPERPPGPCFGTLTLSCKGPDAPLLWDYYLQSPGPESS